MDQQNARPFAEFDDSAGARCNKELPSELCIRPATIADAEAVGRISAERESGVAAEHAERFRREVRDASKRGTSQVLVAELDGQVVGFGRTRYFDEERCGAAGEAPEGWYLAGVVVDPRFRRRGVGSRLTTERLEWIAQRSGSAYYFANALNRVSIALHERFGFAELARGPEFCGVSFTGGEGILFEVDLSSSTWRAP
jgi:ribosomal protein S18 acetylase RimI-like enzyme